MQHTQASKQATNPSCIHNSLKDCNARHSLDVVSHLCSHSQWLLAHTVESASDSSWVGHRTGHFSKQHTFPVSGPWTVELFMIIYTLAPDRYTNCGDRSETAPHTLLVGTRVFNLSTISFHHLFVHFKTKRAIWKTKSNISPFINKPAKTRDKNRDDNFNIFTKSACLFSMLALFVSINTRPGTSCPKFTLGCWSIPTTSGAHDRVLWDGSQESICCCCHLSSWDTIWLAIHKSFFQIHGSKAKLTSCAICHSQEYLGVTLEQARLLRLAWS